MYRVLLADDEPWIIEGLKASIDWKAEGFSVDFTAFNGLEADRIIQEEAPDLALIDIRMPGLNGLEVIARSNESRTGTRFIIMSGYADFEYARRGIELKVDNYLLKPLKEDLLLQQLRELKHSLDIAASEQNDQTARLLLEDMEAETGYLSSLYPAGCYIYLQVGGHLTSLSEIDLRLRIHLQHYMLITSKLLPLSEETLPPDILGLGRVAYCGGSLADALMQAYTLAFRFSVHPGTRLFDDQTALHDIPVLSSPNQNSVRLAAWIENHYTEDISFIDLCTQFSMSSSTVRSRLHQEVGSNFSQYLTNLRMTHAAELLHTDMSINDIAGACGYEDSFYFRRVFKRHFQQTPSQFREHLKESR